MLLEKIASLPSSHNLLVVIYLVVGPNEYFPFHVKIFKYNQFIWYDHCYGLVNAAISEDGESRLFERRLPGICFYDFSDSFSCTVL